MNNKELIVVGAILFALVLGTVGLLAGPSDLQAAQDVSDDAVAAEQDRAARDSRRWVLDSFTRNVCSKYGLVAYWEDDKTPACRPGGMP